MLTVLGPQHRREHIVLGVILLVVCMVLGLLVLALVQVGTGEMPDVLTIGTAQVPSITLADEYPQHFATGPVQGTFLRRLEKE